MPTSDNTTYTFQMPAANVTVSAEFEIDFNPTTLTPTVWTYVKNDVTEAPVTEANPIYSEAVTPTNVTLRGVGNSANMIAANGTVALAKFDLSSVDAYTDLQLQFKMTKANATGGTRMIKVIPLMNTSNLDYSDTWETVNVKPADTTNYLKPWNGSGNYAVTLDSTSLDKAFTGDYIETVDVTLPLTSIMTTNSDKLAAFAFTGNSADVAISDLKLIARNATAELEYEAIAVDEKGAEIKDSNNQNIVVSTGTAVAGSYTYASYLPIAVKDGDNKYYTLSDSAVSSGTYKKQFKMSDSGKSQPTVTYTYDEEIVYYAEGEGTTQGTTDGRSYGGASSGNISGYYDFGNYPVGLYTLSIVATNARDIYIRDSKTQADEHKLINTKTTANALSEITFTLNEAANIYATGYDSGNTPAAGPSYDYMILRYKGGVVYNVKAVDSENNELAVIESSYYGAGKEKTVYVPKVVKDSSGKYYVLDDSSVSNFAKTFTMGDDTTNVTVKYTLDESIVYYVEVESLANQVSGYYPAVNTSSSNGYIGAITKDMKSEVTTLAAGTYSVEARYVANGNRSFNLFTSDGSTYTAVTTFTSARNDAAAVKTCDMTLTSEGVIYAGANSGQSSDYDYIIIRTKTV